MQQAERFVHLTYQANLIVAQGPAFTHGQCSTPSTFYLGQLLTSLLV